MITCTKLGQTKRVTLAPRRVSSLKPRACLVLEPRARAARGSQMPRASSQMRLKRFVFHSLLILMLMHIVLPATAAGGRTTDTLVELVWCHIRGWNWADSRQYPWTYARCCCGKPLGRYPRCERQICRRCVQ